MSSEHSITRERATLIFLTRWSFLTAVGLAVTSWLLYFGESIERAQAGSAIIPQLHLIALAVLPLAASIVGVRAVGLRAVLRIDRPLQDLSAGVQVLLLLCVAAHGIWLHGAVAVRCASHAAHARDQSSLHSMGVSTNSRPEPTQCAIARSFLSEKSHHTALDLVLARRNVELLFVAKCVDEAEFFAMIEQLVAEGDNVEPVTRRFPYVFFGNPVEKTLAELPVTQRGFCNLNAVRNSPVPKGTVEHCETLDDKTALTGVPGD